MAEFTLSVISQDDEGFPALIIELLVRLAQDFDEGGIAEEGYIQANSNTGKVAAATYTAKRTAQVVAENLARATQITEQDAREPDE